MATTSSPFPRSNWSGSLPPDSGRPPSQSEPEADRFADTRAAGRAILAEHLGLDAVTVPSLLDLARATLGKKRSDRCVELARGFRLTQRYQGLSAIASLVAVTLHLGEEWWSRPHRDPVTSPLDDAGPTPDEHLTEAASIDAGTWPPPLVEIGWRTADDVAVDLWGPLIDEVDLNDPRGFDRVQLPAEAVAGQRFVAHFDAGGVVDVVVEPRGATLGSRLGEHRYAVPAEVDWAWGVACKPPGPFPLPGDEPDPYQAVVDTDAVQALRNEAKERGWTDDELGPIWRTRGEVCAALARLDWPWLEGDTKSYEWRKRVEALVDALD